MTLFAWFKQKCVNSMIMVSLGESLSDRPVTKSAGCTPMHLSLLSLKCSFLGHFERVLVNWIITRVRTSKHLPPQVIIEIAGIELTYGIRKSA